MIAPSEPSDPNSELMRNWVLLELHHAWLRLEIAQVEVQWAMNSLASGHVPPHGAFAILECAIDQFFYDEGAI